MSNIIPSFRQSLFNDEVMDVIKDVTEEGIDAVLDEGILKTIPIVNVIVALCKTGMNLKERNFIKQTVKFIKEFNEGKLSAEIVENHRKHLEEDSRLAEKELGAIILFLSDNQEEFLSQMAARIYLSYLKGAFEEEKFFELLEVNKRMFASDYKTLLSLNNTQTGNQTKNKEKYRFGRLMGLGLIVEYQSPAAEKSNQEQYYEHAIKNKVAHLGIVNRDYQITSLGKTLLNCITK